MASAKELRDQGELYDACDEELVREREHAGEICFTLNSLPQKAPNRQTILKEFLGAMGSSCTILAPFSCDYGYNIFVGDNFFANYGCVILDCARVTMGNNVFLGPQCGLYTAIHPLDAVRRNQGLEWAKPITIGDNVWLGGGVLILPEVTIGSNTVIGAGSVVTHSIPSGVVAAGNPARIIKSCQAGTWV